jgi:hypothetical protein
MQKLLKGYNNHPLKFTYIFKVNVFLIIKYTIYSKHEKYKIFTHFSFIWFNTNIKNR